MSHLSLIMDLAQELGNYSNLIREMDPLVDDDFGHGLHPLDIFRPRIHHSMMLPYRRRHTPYARSLMMTKRPSILADGKRSEDVDGLKSLVPVVGKDGFQVCMDVAQFKPNELTVKTVENMVVIEGKHEEREDDHGLIQRHFVRKYTLPKDYDPKEVVSTVSSDGVLTVKAPPPPNKALKENERIVQIQQTGPAHMSIKAPAEMEEGDAAQAQNGDKAAKAPKAK